MTTIGGYRLWRARTALAAIMCIASGVAGAGIRPAWAGECAGGGASGGAPSGAAGMSALYGELANNVEAEPLSVDIAALSISGSCTWVYEVKVLTSTGSVAILDFDLVNLDLKRVRGPTEDPEISRLLDRVNGESKAGGKSESPDATADAGGSGRDAGSGSGGKGDSGDSGGGSGSDSGGGEGGGGEGGSGGGDGGGEGGGSDGGGGGEGGEGGGDD